MGSTFMGLETSKRGLQTQQSALYTTGHNISNANTLGYSRQRVNMEATSGFPGVGLNAGTMPGFLGTGVQAGSIQRIRDGFVDKQFRDETNKLGYWEAQTDAISQMEDVLAEPSDYGLQQSLTDFWKSLGVLSTDPENGGSRAVVVERGVAVADSFNYIHKSMKNIQDNLGKEIGASVNTINSILKQVGDLNKQISEVEPNGYMPNDLYDARDNLLDQLSQLVPIEVKYEKSGGNALAIAEGSVTVTIKTKDSEGLKVVDGKEFAQMRTKSAVTSTDNVNPNGAIEGFYLVKLNPDGSDMKVDKNMVQETGTSTYIRHESFLDQGKLKSLVNSFGKTGEVAGSKVEGLYPDMIAKLNTMAQKFAEKFNEVHMSGTDSDGDKGEAFFTPYTENEKGEITAENIKVNSAILEDPSKLAASDSAVGSAEVGNGNNAKNLGDVLFDKNIDLGNDSVQSYFSGKIIGELGVKGQQAINMTKNAGTLLGAVSNRRDSISSVSLDEEMTNMIQFQQAYNASARMVTVVDETLDKIINGMGIVGR
ncbi:flagellar hook-associated protein FlgK [Sporosarcina sp. BI001-red]|uniref:flagellar hook-associated protein FlgK n=1 Tax=Sporosarcina sp. BI001-red TaxID=2282866 RepID=UPI000E28215A|nr:flagellar hook-associated protein FlgK [Sporosarcina sp. BI001-red]REB08857.1 flagellar hook-associated protein FlgK [Sporosarcina sp. BI001-red]